MNGMRWWAARCAVLLALIAGCSQSAQNGSGEIDVGRFHISEPWAHKNMTVFILSSDRQDEQDYLTLDEGLQDGLVTIAEQDAEQVGSLRIENRSDRPLYLQEGERLEGGKQDRTIGSSMVVAPHSGRVSIPTFCVEHNRWHEKDRGRSFGFTGNAALAPKGVRGAAKVDRNQSGVWDTVEAQKRNAHTKLNSANTNSSVNELLDDPATRSVSDDFAGAFADVFEGDAGRNAVGLVIAINGQIEEANIYPNSSLFRKLGPRLIQAYALHATLLEDQSRATNALTAEDVTRFLNPGGEKSKQERKLDSQNIVLVRELDGHIFSCQTSYHGQVIHWQAMKKNGVENAGRCDALGTDW